MNLATFNVVLPPSVRLRKSGVDALGHRCVEFPRVKMATRSLQSQTFHDQVVRIAAGYLDQAKYVVYTNPDGEKNTKIGNSYPDVIVTNKGESKALFIIEVETQDSITALEAINQWKEYQQLGGTFYLLVPRDSLQSAQQLCNAYSVRAKFGYYWVEDGQLKVHYD